MSAHPDSSALDERTFEAERLGPMRVRVAFITSIAAAIWTLQFVLWESAILPDRALSLAYRGTELLCCAAILVLALRARRLSVLQWGTAGLMSLLNVAHGLALQVVSPDCVVPFTVTMEWGQMVTVLAAMLMFRPALLLLGTTLVAGALATAVRAKWDTDLTDHAVLAGIYGVVLLHVRSVDRLRRSEFETRMRLDRANTELRKNDEARSRLFVNLSHDLRTPLALIHAEAEIAERDGPDERRSAALSRIRLNAASLAELVNQLLELARLDAGRTPRSPKTFDLVVLARRVVAQFEGAHGASAVELVAPDSSLAVHADAGHIHRVLANLVDNATRQVRDGGGRVQIELRSEDEDVIADVVDDGPGIQPARRDVIFERFATFDSAGGLASGIGLPVARELAELEGGTLDIVDAARITFRLRLPLASEPPTELPNLLPTVIARSVDAPSAAARPRSSVGRPLLVVEDHPEMRTLLVELLENGSHDFSVVTAATLSDAKTKLERLTPVAILADIMLPDGSGYDLLDHVRALRAFDGVPVLFVSALGETEQRVRGFSAGADDYITKPFSGVELALRVRAACTRAEQRALALESQRRDFQAELHDGVTASLSRAALLLNANELGTEHLTRARHVVAEALAETRGLLAIADGSPITWPRLVEMVSEDLDTLVQGFPVEASFEANNDASVHMLSAIEQHTLRRVLKEALTNALKHAEPRRIQCRLRGEAGLVELQVDDDGTRVATGSPGRGLAIAQRRLEKLGGALRFQRSEQGGSILSATFPHAHGSQTSAVACSAHHEGGHGCPERDDTHHKRDVRDEQIAPRVGHVR